MPETLSGVIERITFHNEDNGYCVLRVHARGQRDLVTVVGHLSQVIAGEYVEAKGEWVTDRSHGLQFKAEELRTTPPHTTEGIAKYLGSGLVKGIGPKYARKIVDVFGDKTLDVIDRSPAFLTQVKGIGPKRVERIREGWQEQRHVRSIMVFLQSYGVGTARAVRIYKTYGETAIEQVRANPYRLSTDIWGVGFRTADELAQRLGIPRDSPLRARAAVRHVLQEAASNGHVGLPEPLVTEQTAQLTHIDAQTIQGAIEDLRTGDELVRDNPFLAAGVHKRPELTGDPALDDYDTLLYLKPLFLAELGVARAVKALQQGAHPLPATDVDRAVGWVEQKMGIQFADAQRDAVRAAMTRKLLVLTGGPGTGKTTIVRAILEIFQAKSQRVGLCAPTGRAAKRLSESTGREAKTIHRLLEYDVAVGGFRRGKENPLDLDLLVVDETSMADVVLMNQLLRAVPPWACVVLVGDVDQLPSVGPGSVLKDLIESGTVAVVRLTHIHRQAGASWIVRAAHAVNRGEEPESAPPGGQGDFYFVEADDEEAIIDRVLAMVRDRIPARFGLDPFKDVQVLAPMNKGVVGVQNLNKRLQEALNGGADRAREVHRYGNVYRVGDKVIQTQNNYTREVFNGDIGRITAIEPVDQVVVVNFDGREVEYDFGDLDELQLAFAISIHKCVAGYGRTSVRGGGLVPVSEVAVGDRIQTGRGCHRAVLDRIPVGRKPIVRVRTAYGYTIDVSEEHPLLVATEDREPHFRQAGDLTPGVFACIDRSVVPGGPVRLPAITYDDTQKPQKRVSPPGTLTPDMAWALGVIVGDGCCRDKRDGMIDITNQDEELHGAFRGVFEPMGLAVTTRPVRNHFRTYFTSVPLRRWLERLGLGCQLAHEKTTPDIIFRADERCRAAYLRGLFDTDGSVGRINIRFTTASPRMAAEVQELLLSLGVISTRSSQGERHHKVTVSGTGVAGYRERIGFTIPAKGRRLEELAARSARRPGKTNRDVIPFGKGLLRTIRELIPMARGVRGQGLYANGGRSLTFLSTIPRGVSRANYTHLRRAVARLATEGLPIPESAAATLRENYFFDRVVAVERLAAETEMYDLEVEDKHSFVVNGFVCHNSQGSEYPAVVIPLHTTHYIMLQRNLLYTAVTRGKRLVALVGSRKALGIAVRKADTARRFSLLKWRLQNDDPPASPPR